MSDDEASVDSSPSQGGLSIEDLSFCSDDSGLEHESEFDSLHDDKTSWTFIPFAGDIELGFNETDEVCMAKTKEYIGIVEKKLDTLKKTLSESDELGLRQKFLWPTPTPTY